MGRPIVDIARAVFAIACAVPWTVGAASLLPGCAALTATDRAALSADLAIACPALTLVPLVGGLLASACEGEERNLAAVTAAAGAPPAGSAVAAVTVAPGAKAKAVTRRGRGGKRVRVGTVPEAIHARCQAAADALPVDGAADAGAEGGR